MPAYSSIEVNANTVEMWEDEENEAQGRECPRLYKTYYDARHFSVFLLNLYSCHTLLLPAIFFFLNVLLSLVSFSFLFV